MPRQHSAGISLLHVVYWCAIILNVTVYANMLMDCYSYYNGTVHGNSEISRICFQQDVGVR